MEQTLFSSVFAQIFQRRKSDANQQDFENKLNLTCQAQSNPKTIGILTKVFCTSGRNLVALAWMGDELSHGQAQNGVNFELKLNLTLKVKVNHPQNNKVFYTYGPNLVILAWVLSYRVDKLGDGLTDGWPTTIPGGQYWPRVKMASGITKMQKSVIGSVCAFLVFARRILLPSPQLWFVPSRFRPCPTNLPTVKRPFHVG